MTETEREVARKIIQELLDNGIVRESKSPYASPITLVEKKTRGYRFCVDYRLLNAITIKDRSPVPRIQDQYDRLGGNTYFTGLDLSSGYYQVPVSADSTEKTAFVTPDGHYEFTRMPFGLTNASATFQRLMNNVLGPWRYTIAFPYVDDIIIPSRTIQEGLERLILVLDKLREHNLTLNLGKCSFLMTSLDYLGSDISAEGVKPGRKKIEAVLAMPNPTNVREIRQFLGLAGYFRKFIKGYAMIVAPLTMLTRKETKWMWGCAQERAVAKIKEVLTTRPILVIYDGTLRTELHTDASSLGVGAILFQFTAEGKQQVVGYFSKQTTNDQRKYHSYELEMMAVVLALRHFRVYLLELNFRLSRIAMRFGPLSRRRT